MTVALATGLIWGLGYVVGYWMGKLNEQAKQVARDLQEVQENVAQMETALRTNGDDRA